MVNRIPILDEIEFGMDRGTLVIVGILAVIYIVYHLYHIFKAHHQNKMSKAREIAEINALREKKSRERALDSLYRLEIDMEMDEMLEKEGLL